jgi:hypothetical protein
MMHQMTFRTSFLLGLKRPDSPVVARLYFNTYLSLHQQMFAYPSVSSSKRPEGADRQADPTVSLLVGALGSPPDVWEVA